MTNHEKSPDKNKDKEERKTAVISTYSCPVRRPTSTPSVQCAYRESLRRTTAAVGLGLGLILVRYLAVREGHAPPPLLYEFRMLLLSRQRHAVLLFSVQQCSRYFQIFAHRKVKSVRMYSRERKYTGHVWYTRFQHTLHSNVQQYEYQYSYDM